ncbi:hypothetical protein [Kibdelosporangium aridum]|uniref:hypothetical protein n=1 Tax=Kibdelosporangium aridum TaxID=2030 RepID=UPI0035EDC5CA
MARNKVFADVTTDALHGFTDSDQIALDPKTRTQDGNPFPNAYHEWNTERGQAR